MIKICDLCLVIKKTEIHKNINAEFEQGNVLILVCPKMIIRTAQLYFYSVADVVTTLSDMREK